MIFFLTINESLNDADRIKIDIAVEIPKKRREDDFEDEDIIEKPREIRDALEITGYRKPRGKNQSSIGREKWRFTVGCFTSDVRRGHLSVLEPDFLVTNLENVVYMLPYD